MINILLYQTLAFTIHGKIKKWYKNNKCKISAPTWNEEFELPGGPYSVSDIQDCFEYILKNHETVTDNPSVMLYVNEIENIITLKIKTRFYLKLWKCASFRNYWSNISPF